MTRFVHDQFAKQYLKELLSPMGQVETSRDMAGEVRQIDVWFAPSSQQPAAVAETLGLLGKFAATPAVFEPFRNAVTPAHVRSCMSKLFQFYAELERNRESGRIAEADLPQLWILSPTVSASILESFGAIPAPDNWMSGVYFLASSLKTAIVAIHQLPRTPETLWVRVLGKGNVQKQAIAELKALPKDNPFRGNALELLYNLRTILEVRQDLEQEDRELIMELSPLYLQRLEDATRAGVQEGIQQGLQQGVQQGQRLMVESMLQVKFGALDEELSQIIEPLIQLEPLERTQLIMLLNRQELLARFSRQQ
ncbi:hypothetical protein [Kamptonema formosum]|uniref:hypothetical protein n=1 Tax=Kamptonema formosum TaxID=331992 RepID=UPI00047724E9|nr:hypothetical protein [Oscillatoria sp. PCC 10802]